MAIAHHTANILAAHSDLHTCSRDKNVPHSPHPIEASGTILHKSKERNL